MHARMGIKKCCIRNCKSCSTRKEDNGVTYHKFPKDTTTLKKWFFVTRCKNPQSHNYVCSRHFYKSDFHLNEDSKYTLKSDALPAIFSWSKRGKNLQSRLNFGIKPSLKKKMTDPQENEQNLLGCSSNEYDENVDAIKKFIEQQTKEIEDQKLAIVREVSRNHETDDNNIRSKQYQKDGIPIISNVMDMILSDSDKITDTMNVKEVTQQDVNTAEKMNSSMSLSIGSRVEVKDFSEDWHIGDIVEVDYDEMEVLVQYERNTKKHNEWISVSSPRLRPIGSGPAKPPSDPVAQEVVLKPIPIKEEDVELKIEKADNKSKLLFDVGERCLARWRDNRRFMATVHSYLGNGTYEVIFDDGSYWKCNTARLYKWKPGKNDPLSVDTSLNSPITSTPSPIQSGGPSSSITPTTQPIFHTHLFDPTRDYLGSKSERREMKRKLNIKEIFNIGQKRSKLQKAEKLKHVVQKQPRVVKNPPKAKSETAGTKRLKSDVKAKLPDAVASIIGTIHKDTSDTSKVITKNINKVKEKPGKHNVIDNNDEETETQSSICGSIEDADESTLSDEGKSDIDPVLEEEVKLEQFEKQDDTKYEMAIDRMKEVINKLEDGLRNENRCSPKLEIQQVVPIVPKVEIKEEFEDKFDETVEEKVDENDKNKIEEKVTPKVEEKDAEKVKEIVEAKFDEVQVKIEEKIEAVKGDVNTEKKSKINKLKKLSKIKKNKKLRLLREKKVKKQVEKVKNELEEMKKQVDEMRKQMLMKTQELTNAPTEMPESFLLPEEWCCRWVNGQPVGAVSEVVSELKLYSDGRPALPRRSVQVDDKRLPPGWTKHMVRRSFGHSAGKWDVVLVSPDNRRFHTKTDMRNYLETSADKSLCTYEYALTDFGVHLKLSRRMGWISNTPSGVADGPTQPVDALCVTSPLIKKKKKKPFTLGQHRNIGKRKKLMIKPKPQLSRTFTVNPEVVARPSTSKESDLTLEATLDAAPLEEEGYVYVGSLKVQIIENLLRCPSEGCFKNFRNNTLLQMHIKHYHRELRKLLGSTPKVLDLAYARTMPTVIDTPKQNETKILKVKINRLPKREETKSECCKANSPDQLIETEPEASVSHDVDNIPRPQDSPKLRDALINKPVKRPKVLLPVRRLELELPDTCASEDTESVDNNNDDDDEDLESHVDMPTNVEQLDFETAICTHTVTKPINEKGKKIKKRNVKTLKACYAAVAQRQSEEDDWFAGNSDYESRSSFPRSGTPDSKTFDRRPAKYMIPEMNVRHKQQDTASYMYTETGEKIKLVRMRREEIINCHCGYREEDGLMVQCELCLCWQHALCHNISNESQVPEKYTCSICLNPRRGRRSMRFLHDQDRLYEGLLPGAKPCDSLRRSHELSGNLLLIRDALHALRVKGYVAIKKNHPKLYLWAQDWEQAEITSTQEKLSSGYSDLTIVPNNVNKDAPPLNRNVIRDVPLPISTPSSEEQDFERYEERDDSQEMLSDLMTNPGDAALELPISTSELEQLANTVQEVEESAFAALSAPQPEPPIENSVCRKQLLSHIQHCQALIDARLDSIEAQVAELESQDPTVEGDDTADSFPRTKQTVKMLMRDLNALEELGIIT